MVVTDQSHEVHFLCHRIRWLKLSHSRTSQRDQIEQTALFDQFNKTWESFGADLNKFGYIMIFELSNLADCFF